MSAQSIYSVIYEGINSEGKLPKDFTLPLKRLFQMNLSYARSKRRNRYISLWSKKFGKVSKKIVKLLKVTVKRVVSAHK